MKRIMTLVICVLVVLTLSICWAQFQRPKKVKDGQIFKIEFSNQDGSDPVVVEFGIKGYDEHDNPQIVELNPAGAMTGKPWGQRAYQLPTGAEEIIAIYYVNPQCIRINGVLRCK